LPINSVFNLRITFLTIFEAFWLGILQGLTEFLPVSSSGHLVIAQAVAGIRNPGMAFEIYVHFGTLLSILVIFRNDLSEIIISFIRKLKSPKTLISGYKDDKNYRLLILLLLATIPAGVIGLLFKDFFEKTFSDINFVGFALILTGIILFISKFAVNRNKEVCRKRALLIGFAQALAIFPGISRSGTSITAAMISGVSGEQSARFSFLLAIPAIAGATLLQLLDISSSGAGNISYVIAGVGIVSSFITGTLAISLLMQVMRKGKMHYFSGYCIAAGLVTIYFI